MGLLQALPLIKDVKRRAIGTAFGGLLIFSAYSAPPNDDFANATAISGESGTATGDNFLGSLEVNEPYYFDDDYLYGSVWWKWTAPATSIYVFDTAGSNISTALRVYTGSSLIDITPVEQGNEIWASNYTLASFSASEDQEFYIQVLGQTELGSIQLNWRNVGIAENDNFANATPISGKAGSLSGANYGATMEPTEPVDPNSDLQHTVWYSWTAPETGSYLMTCTTEEITAALGIFSGNKLGALYPVSLTYDHLSTDQSSAAFEATAGEEYSIRVNSTGWEGSVGSFKLSWKDLLPLANDNIADAVSLPGATGSISGHTYGATVEMYEPEILSTEGESSVWYTWTAPSADPVAFDTFGSSFDTALAIYTGTSMQSLVLVAENDAFGQLGQSFVSFTPAAGETYFVTVNGIYGDAGNFELNWGPPPAPPANDNLGDAIALSDSGSLSSSNLFATGESGEPGGVFIFPPQRTLWWSWTAPESNRTSFELQNLSSDLKLTIYTGTAFSDLTVVTQDEDDLCLFDAVEGQTYYVQVADVFNSASDFDLIWGPAPPSPANDDLANAIEISGAAGYVTANNKFATRELNEPDADGLIGSQRGYVSLWYKWTAPSGDAVTFETVGSRAQTLLGVYNEPPGELAFPLDTVAENDQAGPDDYFSRLTFTPTSGNTYYIVVDSYRSPGKILLSWRPPSGAELPLENDDFADAITLAGDSGAIRGHNVGATQETGEPDTIMEETIGTSVWYQWTPSVSGTWRFDLNRPTGGLIPLFGIYTGSLGSFNAVEESDDSLYSNSWATILLDAQAGQTYQIIVDSYEGNGAFDLVWYPIGGRPANDDFADAITLTGEIGSATGSTLYATPGPEDPEDMEYYDGFTTVWWKWTAPASTRASLNTFGSGFENILAVLTFQQDTLQVLAVNDGYLNNDSSISFDAQADTTYYIMVSGIDGEAGDVVLNWATGIPGNDDFANAFPITGSFGTTTGVNANATDEAGEPNTMVNEEGYAEEGRQSVWWSWTPPDAGVVTFSTYGSTFNTQLGIYTGSSLDDLVVIEEKSASEDSPGQPVITFAVTEADINAGTVYKINVRGLRNETVEYGNIQLHWSGTTPVNLSAFTVE